MEICRDFYLDKLIKRKNNGLIKVITGIRRCGKSYLLNNLFYHHLLESGVDADHIIRFAFDSADLDCKHLWLPPWSGNSWKINNVIKDAMEKMWSGTT